MRDIRTENALFWPHMRNTSYEAFFEQSTERKLATSDCVTRAASMHHIDHTPIQHAILDLENALSEVLACMESHGVYVDIHTLSELDKTLSDAIRDCERSVADLT